LRRIAKEKTVPILKSYLRVWVPDLDTWLPFYETLVGSPVGLRFRFEAAELAAVGDILLIAGPPEATDRYRDTIGPLIVDDLGETLRLLRQHGAEILGAPVQVPTGTMVYVRHADGTQVEYLQFTPDLVERIIGDPANAAAG
jgi:predicted enzyme related to lactoylglutathione lyase